MPYDAVFNARSIEPRQGGGAHPVGNKWPFSITGTEVKDTKDKSGKYFEVEFTSPAGSIKNNYNLWNGNAQAVKIAAEQLSALCHATGIFDVDFKNEGAALRNAQGMMDVGFQKGHEPSAEKPEGGYVEVKKVYDRMGNEPGKAPAQQTQQQQMPQQQANGPQVQSGGFNPNPAAQPAQQNWNAGQAQQPQQTNNAGGWNPGATMPDKAPWS